MGSRYRACITPGSTPRGIDSAGRSEHPAARRVDQDFFAVAGGTDRAMARRTLESSRLTVARRVGAGALWLGGHSARPRPDQPARPGARPRYAVFRDDRGRSGDAEEPPRTLNKSREAGVTHVEVFDGSDCGWTHDRDPDKANRTVRTAEEAAQWPISDRVRSVLLRIGWSGDHATRDRGSRARLSHATARPC